MIDKLDIPRILIAGDRSSAGKTTISIGIMSVLRDMGYKVQPFKVGLDFIDPSYHTEVTGRYSRNLDGYLMPERTVSEVFSHAVEDADIAVIEGVRGLFEGLEATSDIGSTAQIAKLLRCPVVLVINARSITRSAAAVVSGYRSFDPEVNIAGVILNNIGSQRHSEKARTAIETYTGIRVIGEVPRNSSMKISMRHLGLIPALEGRRRLSDFDENLGKIKTIINENVDIDRFLSLAKSAEPLPRPEKSIFNFKARVSESAPRIGVAYDEAFNFYYRDNLELLELAGAELVYFSPVNDRSLPRVDGLYIGGGYPELFAQELEDNSSMRESIKQVSSEGLPVYAECGGLMYLTRKIEMDVTGSGNYNMAQMQGGTFSMVGAVPGRTLMGHKRVVSYNIGRFVKDNMIGKSGNSFIGHEFHHSEVLDLPDDTTFAIRLDRGTGIRGEYDGILVGNTMAAYAHLHAASYTGFARSFVDSCSGQK
ncbi:hydrogenobyrinic acid a,c-diamide synthase [Candidatus Methanoperedens nitroreducens]|uniref:Cobyrinate a,c-diamide synthase n=1 Tax=Candidatus Methanoperedens nitratireducens TaxID=1392998 RepID=A0A062V4V5_9EURY|nr:Ni-sirohydrochlorin a,c-diamide synthase [Candidatus Methanoperedens nitroreducens]KCZ71643.1 hydrogenobyrinic acid a,c-diamide synthase [Candidatus Methanoperedens nitroreducens]MDJ1421271.1 Ni-sirohydrochlorin a,c-diamide synthase [Candidatus Methanoperedens sp.]